MKASTEQAPDQMLASALRQLRRDSVNTQEDIAHRAGIAVAALARIERGQSNPHWTTVTRIAGALGISLAELIEVVEDAVP